MAKQFKGKTALVTGGASGIGAAITAAFAAAGARVAVADLVRPRRADAGMAAALYRRTDVSDEDSVRSLMHFVGRQCGGLDILVNNAGIALESPLCEMSAADWDRLFAVNVRGVFLCAKHAAPLMRRRGGGAVVNIGSIEASGANPLHAAYAASKGAVHSLTRNMALELGDDGIRCNAIAPGWIDTPLNDSLIARYPDPQAARKAIIGLHPAGRTGKPEDVAQAALWLASADAGFVSGQVYVVDGGRTARLPTPPLSGA